jgi:hypothetical protein
MFHRCNQLEHMLMLNCMFIVDCQALLLLMLCYARDCTPGSLSLSLLLCKESNQRKIKADEQWLKFDSFRLQRTMLRSAEVLVPAQTNIQPLNSTPHVRCLTLHYSNFSSAIVLRPSESRSASIPHFVLTTRVVSPYFERFILR